MNGVYLITGGNLGNRQENLQKGSLLIEELIGVIEAHSSIYETASWGKIHEPNYLNQVLFVKTSLSAQEVLKECLLIEEEMGRVRQKKWESRLIDIDILFFNDEVYSLPNLKIPHPHLAQRKFVLIPLNEIASDFTHPILYKRIQELLELCQDTLEVNKYTP